MPRWAGTTMKEPDFMNIVYDSYVKRLEFLENDSKLFKFLFKDIL